MEIDHYQAVGILFLLDFITVLQKEENEPFSSRGRGRERGGARNAGDLSSCCCCVLFLFLQDVDWASAGCCLLKRSTMQENKPSVTQFCRRACGAPAAVGVSW